MSTPTAACCPATLSLHRPWWRRWHAAWQALRERARRREELRGFRHTP